MPEAQPRRPTVMEVIEGTLKSATATARGIAFLIGALEVAKEMMPDARSKDGAGVLLEDLQAHAAEMHLLLHRLTFLSNAKAMWEQAGCPRAPRKGKPT